MKVLVTGAQGMLGPDVCLALERADHQVAATGMRPGVILMDVTDIAAVRAVLYQQKPEVVIHCAAFTNVDGAESERDEAFRVNALGSWSVAAACEEIGAAICAISTDYVFDGRKTEPYTEFDPLAPIGAYGESKAAGEVCVRQACFRHWIVRSSWLYGLHGKCFPDTMLKAAEAGKQLRVVADQMGSPTYTNDLAAALVTLIESSLFGTYHIVNRGATSWHGFAGKTLEIAGHDKSLVTPIKSTDWPTPAARPANSVLRPLALEMQGRYEMRTWEDALEEYVGKRRAALVSGQNLGRDE
jgi:dTDP-4-dehydrorhamnose reductase